MKQHLFLLAILLIFGNANSQIGDTLDMYYYKNSLYNHLETGNSDANSSTNVGNWIARFTAVPSNPKFATLGSVFGFFNQWKVPPTGGNFHTEISTPHLQKWSPGWNDAKEIELVGFVPDNFDGQAFDPSDTTNMGQAYVVKLLELIDEWEENAPNKNRRYVVYSGWPALNRYGGTNDDPSTLTTTGLENWLAYGLGDYQDWMELLVKQLKEARPNLDIRLHNISKSVLMCYKNTLVKDIATNVLFEDLAPHGRSTWYFLAAIAEYIEIFGEKPPSNFNFDKEWGVDSTVTSNYQSIVDYIWGVVGSNSTSVHKYISNEPLVVLYPNPASSILKIKTSLTDLEVTLYDFLGGLVIKQKGTDDISLVDLSAGTYIVECINESIVYRQKLLIH